MQYGRQARGAENPVQTRALPVHYSTCNAHSPKASAWICRPRYRELRRDVAAVVQVQIPLCLVSAVGVWTPLEVDAVPACAMLLRRLGFKARQLFHCIA